MTFSRCCQSGVRCPGRRRGMRSARAAFSRNLEPKSADCASSASRRSSISSGRRAKIAGGRRDIGVREVERDAVVRPQRLGVDAEVRRAACAESAIAQGACTRPPNGVRTQTRQSPISSRKRSTTIERSDGTTPVAASCSRRNVDEVPRGPLARGGSRPRAAPRSRRRRARRARASPCRCARRARRAGRRPRPSRTARRRARREPARRARGRA